MRERQRGTIITISSIAGKRASKLGGAAYTASKYGVEGLTHTIGVEEIDNHIRTCVISPGEVDTEILRFRPNPVTDEHRAAMLKPEDIAAAVRFVAELPDYATPSKQAWRCLWPFTSIASRGVACRRTSL